MQAGAGARMQLKLVTASPNRAEYHVELAMGDQTWTACAEVETSGTIGVRDWDSDPPNWLFDALRGLLRAVARSAAAGTRLGPGEGWPRRIQRWRAAP